MNFNPETKVHDDMYDIKYRQTDTLYETVLFKSLKHIRVSCAMFKVTSFIYFALYSKLFDYLEKYIR